MLDARLLWSRLGFESTREELVDEARPNNRRMGRLLGDEGAAEPDLVACRERSEASCAVKEGLGADSNVDNGFGVEKFWLLVEAARDGDGAFGASALPPGDADWRVGTDSSKDKTVDIISGH